MSEILTTFSGKYGDILWALPTVREISRLHSAPVDLKIMPYYESLLPLLQGQPYIERAQAAPEWVRTNSNYGDQPWRPPDSVSEGYKAVYHLTYKAHPGISAPDMPLVDFIAWQQGIRLKGDGLPFITVDESVEAGAAVVWFGNGQFMDVVRQGKLIAYAFNDQYQEVKAAFFQSLYRELEGEFEFFNVGVGIGWRESAWVIQKARMFVGCRSANWVVANGVGKETITYEPHPSRHQLGHLGKVFSCPYGKELALPFNMPPEPAGQAAAALIRKKVKGAGA